MAMYKLQEQIKHNSDDMHNAVHDLYKWAENTTQKEKTGSNKAAPVSKAKLPPVRNKIDIDQSIIRAQ